MIRSIICAAAAALSLGVGTVGAEDAAIATAFTAGDAVRIRYVLPSPTARLAFADRDVVRETWTVLTPGVTLAGDVISSETPFDTVELEIRPDSAERDRIYMGLSRIGDGHILYGPALRLEGVPTTLAFHAAEGAAALPAEGAIEGYAYLGPDDQVSSAGEARVVAGRNVSAELSGPMRETFRRALEVYGARLGPDLPYTPTLAISVDSPGPAMFRGDVTDTGVISTRFRGDVWKGAEGTWRPSSGTRPSICGTGTGSARPTPTRTPGCTRAGPSTPASSGPPRPAPSARARPDSGLRST